MKDLSQVTALVYDHGLFLPLAERMARDCKRVLYHTHWQEGFSTVNKASIGAGMELVERCDDIWEVKNDVDLFIFPDVQHSGLQLELESQGFPVWGARRADRLELHREFFLKQLENLKLDVPKHTVCVGINPLREELRERENCYIKISKYRGSLETHHWRSWKLDENWLDLLAVRFGTVRHSIRFLVFEAIDTPLEIGGDTYSIDGQWPELMLHGIESKDTAYFAAVTKRPQMPEQLQKVIDAFSPLMRRSRYRNEWSMEVRVLGGKSYFIDPTTRGGLPSTGSQIELWGNFSEIVWQGAHGQLVEPEPLGKFSAEIILKAKADDALWPTVEIPKDLRQWCKLADCCEVDGVTSWPREGGDDHCVGWLVAIGDTPEETLVTLKGYVKDLPEGLTADIAPLADVLNEIEIEEDKGIRFTDHELPEPAEVIES